MIVYLIKAPHHLAPSQARGPRLLSNYSYKRSFMITKERMIMPVELTTAQGEFLLQNPDAPVWQVYPRPQMKRNSYLNLNGWWELTCAEDAALPE